MTRSNILFVFFEYLIGLGFAIAGIFIFSKYDRSSLMTSIFYGFAASFISMYIGIVLVGYFHLRAMRRLNKFTKALLYTFTGILLFTLLYILVESILPEYLGILLIIIPLTGGVMGFNLALRTNE